LAGIVYLDAFDHDEFGAGADVHPLGQGERSIATQHEICRQRIKLCNGGVGRRKFRAHFADFTVTKVTSSYCGPG
jgi:hypothetical protein